MGLLDKGISAAGKAIGFGKKRADVLVSAAVDQLPQIIDTAKDAATKAQQEAVKAADGLKQQVAKSVEIAKSSFDEGYKTAEQQIEEEERKKREDLEMPKGLVKRFISTQSAFKIMYLFMAVDGEICEAEKDLLDAVCAELDPNLLSSKDRLVEECEDILHDLFTSGNDLKEAVAQLLKSADSDESAALLPRQLLWDLFSLSYSDGEYSQPEKELLAYIANELEVDEAVLLEMESSLKTLSDIANELAWVKTTEVQGLNAEKLTKELEGRRNVVMKSVVELTTL